ncbi:MAG TPA: TIGR02186 family protein [Methylomirabilota bacterium]|nr:TIGR02186 family protein [Methylomirabilota bacterium]
MSLQPVLLLALFAFAAAMLPSRAEQLVTALSHDRVSISSNFTGTQVVVFGTIERDAQTVARAGGYDIVVTLAGPMTTLVTRRKERTFGIWINADSEVIGQVPSFLSIHTTGPISDIASDTARARLGLGLDMLPINVEPTAKPPVRTSFENAFLRLMLDENRYSQIVGGVEVMGANLFRATITLPATISVGEYTAKVQLFRGGALLSTTTETLRIGKIGFEQYVSEVAKTHGFLYGLATVAIACLTGWVAGVVFRRD